MKLKIKELKEEDVKEFCLREIGDSIFIFVGKEMVGRLFNDGKFWWFGKKDKVQFKGRWDENGIKGKK